MRRLRIVVAARAFAAPEQGGATWAALQWVLGFGGLGHDVLLAEPAPRDPAVVDAAARTATRFGLDGRVALLHDGRRTSGVPYGDVVRFATTADVLVNLGGVPRDDELWARVARRVYVDLDPGFTQLWHSSGVDVGLAGHDLFFTVGQCVGTPLSSVPDCGVRWHAVVPPVAFDHWPVTDEPPRYGWTTVANWRSYGSISHDGVVYGQKAHSFRLLAGLPGRRPDEVFEPAVAIHPGDDADAAALATHGWQVRDPLVVAGDPDRYAAFVRASTAELGVAKSGYIAARTGWFSDRSACYLASGRPVVAQDTGFSDRLPTGEGLLAFTDADDAVAAIAEVRADYHRHAKAARAVALDHLDARSVLPSVLDTVGAT